MVDFVLYDSIKKEMTCLSRIDAEKKFVRNFNNLVSISTVVTPHPNLALPRWTRDQNGKYKDHKTFEKVGDDFDIDIFDECFYTEYGDLDGFPSAISAKADMDLYRASCDHTFSNILTT